MDQVLEKIRGILQESHQMNDSVAEDVILKTVLDDYQYAYASVKEIEKTVEKLFIKTRRKMGPIEEYVRRDDINEIMVNGINNIFIEKKGQIIKTDQCFDTVEDLEEVIRYIAGSVHREINEMNPIVDARLSDGSRVNGVYKNIALNGPILTIRKFRKKYITMDDLIIKGSLTAECAELLATLVKYGYNIFICGGTSSGKTTFLNALADYIPQHERVIVIEDSAELQLESIPNIVRLECRKANSMGKGQIEMDQLIKTSLRMRPDRILVGEVRGKEVAQMLQALNTGHSGSMSTGHGNSVKGMLRRLEAMYLMDSHIPLDAIAGQIIEGIDIMIHLGKLGSGIRKVLQVSEIVGYNHGDYVLNELFKINEKGELRPTGNSLLKREKLNLGRNIDEG